MSKKLDVLELDPKRWYRGNGSDQSYLRRNDGKMCCLGFECRRRGILARVITGVGLPSEVSSAHLSFEEEEKLHAPFLEQLQGDEVCGEPRARENIESRIAFINDNSSIDDRERMKQLRPLFRKLGVRLVLKGAK